MNCCERCHRGSPSHYVGSDIMRMEVCDDCAARAAELIEQFPSAMSNMFVAPIGRLTKAALG